MATFAVIGLRGFRQPDGCYGPEHLRQRDAVCCTGAGMRSCEIQSDRGDLVCVVNCYVCLFDNTYIDMYIYI